MFKFRLRWIMVTIALFAIALSFLNTSNLPPEVKRVIDTFPNLKTGMALQDALIILLPPGEEIDAVSDRGSARCPRFYKLITPYYRLAIDAHRDIRTENGKKIIGQTNLERASVEYFDSKDRKWHLLRQTKEDGLGSKKSAEQIKQ